MRNRSFHVFLSGVVIGVLLTLAGVKYLARDTKKAAREPAICYSCFWQGSDPKLRSDLIEYFRQFKNPDPLIMADAGYVLWRLTGNPNCDLRSEYRKIAASDADTQRRYVANSVLAFGADECGEDPARTFRAAADSARQMGLAREATALKRLGENNLQPRFASTKINTELRVPAGASTMVLGESKVEVSSDTRVVSQVDRVARDWISNQLRWDLSSANLRTTLDYHEGAIVGAILQQLPTTNVHAATGVIAAKQGDTWFAMDDEGEFRFALLPDKLMYPTTHVFRDFAWIEDTHGISALVPFAIESKAQLVIGCGDAVGKAEAAYYLAQRGINVMFPGDRYQDLLLGYTGSGTLLGGAPVKPLGSKVVIGDQPVSFSLAELIVVEDTKKLFPIQYYDSGARYFRRLALSAPTMRLRFVDVDGPDELFKVINVAHDKKSRAIAVRIMTQSEDFTLRSWLLESKLNRAILFHSGLYPFAQPLFRDFPQQVTFGDLRPRFH